MLRLLLLMSLILIPGFSSEEPELVQVLFRNGEINPKKSELTELGKFRNQQLGRRLRLRYPNLLAQSCNITYARSLDHEYNKASLDEFLTELCPNQTIQTLVVSSNLDELFNSRACHKYQVELDIHRSSTEIQQKLDKYSGLYSYMKQEIGMTIDHTIADERLYKLYNLMEAIRSMNISLPEWCPEGVFYLLRDIAYLHYNIESGTKILRQLNGGPFLRRFLESKNHKFYIYSGNGNNVAGLARVLGRHYPRVPSYGSALILEKWKIEEIEFVRTVVWTGVSEKIFPIKVKNCSIMCPLGEFKKIFSEVIPSDKDLRCLLDEWKNRKLKKVSMN